MCSLQRLEMMDAKTDGPYGHDAGKEAKHGKCWDEFAFVIGFDLTN